MESISAIFTCALGISTWYFFHKVFDSKSLFENLVIGFPFPLTEESGNKLNSHLFQGNRYICISKPAS